MYLNHFGFKCAPFERDLPADHLYGSPYFAEGLAG